MSFSRTIIGTLAAALCLAGGSIRAAETQTIDPVHSSVVFKINHFGISNIFGRFNEFSGKIVLDAADAKKSSVEVSIKAESVDTANAGRDKHLKGPDFFNTKQFGSIDFKSKEVKASATGLEVKGDLTLHGVTKEITVKATKVGTGKGMAGEGRVGYETTFKVKRSDHGMKFMLDKLGDEVELTACFECAIK